MKEYESLFARVADILRRCGTEDAERLIAALEAVLLPRSMVGDQIVVFQATIPAGPHPAG